MNSSGVVSVSRNVFVVVWKLTTAKNRYEVSNKEASLGRPDRYREIC